MVPTENGMESKRGNVPITEHGCDKKEEEKKQKIQTEEIEPLLKRSRANQQTQIRHWKNVQICKMDGTKEALPIVLDQKRAPQ